MNGSDQHSADQHMFDQSSAKFSGANEPRKMLTSLQPSPSRYIQSANLHNQTSKSRFITRNRRLKNFHHSKGTQGFTQYEIDMQNSKSTVNTHANDNLSSKRTASQFTQHAKNHRRGLSGTIRGGKPWQRPLLSSTQNTGRSLNRSSIGGDALTSVAGDRREGFASQMVVRQDEGTTRQKKVQQMLELQKSDPEGFQMALEELMNQAEAI